MTSSTAVKALLLALPLLLVTACQSSSPQMEGDDGNDDMMEEPASFSDDVAFMREHGDVQVLEADDGGRVALSAQYQGRVMTSSIAPDGRSFGWVNRSFIEEGETGTPFDNFGGEDRFWLGPEGGQYGLYFEPGAEFTEANWQVPHAMQEGTWEIAEQSDRGITYTRSMSVSNYQGVDFELDVERRVQLLSERAISRVMDIDIPDNVEHVGFQSVNTVTNAGGANWDRAEGLPSIWILGQFETFRGATRIVVPYDEGGSGQIVNDAYFQDLGEDRLVAEDGYVVYRADGKYRSKIGLGPSRAMPMFGSYNPDGRQLTLIQYKKLEGRTDYVNSLWKQQDEPYGGDVINAYNDRPTPEGEKSFYELETSSPALDLAPGESYTHPHRTLHLIGPPETLNRIMEEALGVSTEQVADAL